MRICLSRLGGSPKSVSFQVISPPDPYVYVWLTLLFFSSALGITINDVIYRSHLGDKALLLGRIIRINWPLLAVSYGGVALTGLFYNIRGKDNWGSNASPYFLGFATMGSAVYSR